jgi:hypothetical protein
MDLSLLDNPQVMVLPGPCPSCLKRVDLLHGHFVSYLRGKANPFGFFKYIREDRFYTPFNEDVKKGEPLQGLLEEFQIIDLYNEYLRLGANANIFERGYSINDHYKEFTKLGGDPVFFFKSHGIEKFYDEFLKYLGTSDPDVFFKYYEIKRICCRTALTKPDIHQLGAAYYNNDAVQARRETDVSPISGCAPDVAGSILNAKSARRVLSTSMFGGGIGTKMNDKTLGYGPGGKGPMLGGPSSIAREPIRPRGYAPPLPEIKAPISLPGMTVTNPSARLNPVLPAASKMFVPPPTRPLVGFSFGGVNIPRSEPARLPTTPMRLMSQSQQTAVNNDIPQLQTRVMGITLTGNENEGWRPNEYMPTKDQTYDIKRINLTDAMDVEPSPLTLEQARVDHPVRRDRDMDLGVSPDYPMGRRMSIATAAATSGALIPGVWYPMEPDTENSDIRGLSIPKKSSRVGPYVIRGHRDVGQGYTVPVVSAFQFAT